MRPEPRGRGLVLAVALVVLGACGGNGTRDGAAGAPRTAAEDPSARRPVAADPPASAWAQASGDAARSSPTTTRGPATAHVRWKRQFPGAVTPGPAVAADGSLLVGANDGILRALDPADGRTRWSFDGGGRYGIDLSTTPAVLGDGTILWPGPRDRLFALDRRGRQLWVEQFDAQVLSPAVVGGGRVYVADQSGLVRALDVAGAEHTVAWAHHVAGTSYSSPAVGPDGTVYAAAGSSLTALIDRGSSAVVAWTFTARDIIEVSPAVATDGTVILGTNSDVEYGLERTGSVRWRFPKGHWSYSSPVVRGPLTYFGDHTGVVNAVDVTTGQLRTRFDVVPAGGVGGFGPWTAPLVDATGNLFVGTEAGHVFGFAPDGRRLWDLDTGAVVASYPALTSDGLLVIGDQSGTVYAIGA